ncbi:MULTISPECIES: HipA domain-containing protein [Variovorax]|uniref:HipA domain-containing protein n=1 Tax=Variovorax TaxID=34072 RepID=UPI0028679C3B|nr:HipA domain-containing protein [Variovorax sp. 3319]MDR6890932.1 serine/threonine-protein kinase HipA [Variovorax sp. 3319]
MSEAEDRVHRLRVTHDGGTPVGELAYAGAEDRWSFRYDPAWARQGAFQLSPAFPFEPPAGGYDSHAIRRFIVNLFPEGAPLRAALEQLHVAPSNAFALLRGMGGETTGALEFQPVDQPIAAAARREQRALSREELSGRIDAAKEGGLTVWDGRVRMSIAGYQDKLAVWAAHDLVQDPEASMWLPEPPLASTFILKPQPAGARTPHLVANEHYCMTLARAYAAQVARVAIMRLPVPVLVVARFDRQWRAEENQAWVSKLHVIDGCQAADLSVDAKYERNLGNSPELARYRDGMSLPRLFSLAALMRRPAVARLEMLRWALFQLVVGNCDAHGKNFSFFVDGTMLEPAPWYDVVSVAQYPGLDQSFAMAFGDAFAWEELSAMELAHFAHLCGIDQRLLHREAQRLSRAMKRAPELLCAPTYTKEECDFLRPIYDLVQQRSQMLVGLAAGAGAFNGEHF